MTRLMRAHGSRLSRLVVLALLAGCATSRPVPEPRFDGDVTAFVGVTVVPMTDTRTLLPNQTVVVSGSRIVSIGNASQVRIPSDAHRIDGSDLFLMPGLADMHVHLEYFEEPDVLKLFLAHGVTTVRNMDGRPYILRWKAEVADGRLSGPTIHTAGPLLDGDPPILPDNTVIRNAAEARAAVLEQAAAGYDFVKVYTNLSLEAYRAVVQTARERGMPISGHVPRRVDLAEALAGDLASVEHLADYGDAIEANDSPHRDGWHWSKLYVAMPVSARKIDSAAAAITASRVWTVPTMVQANRALAPPETVRVWLDEPAMAYIPTEGRTLWTDRLQRATARMDADDWAAVARGRENRARLVRALHAAGAGLLIGTDTPNPFVIPGVSVAEELTHFVAAGLTPGAALAAATRDAARFLGEEGEWGTVTAGRRADLLLLDANPLEDVGNVRRIAGVMVRGRWLPAAELGAMLEGVLLR